MGATASLQETSLAVSPGEAATTTLVVRNTGSVVDELSFQVLGDARAWATVTPETLSLFPGDEGTVTITLAPPRLASTPTGTVPFGVKVSPREDPQGSVVEEGALEIAAFSDVTAELVPHTSRGRGGAKHELAVDNRGNDRLNADVEAADPDRLLRFELDPPSLVAPPGTAQFANVRVKPRKRIWRGVPQTRPFQVSVRGGGAAPVAVDGTFLQEAIIPRWLPKALLALAALAIALAALWFGLIKPSAESAGREAAQQQAEQQDQRLSNVEDAVEEMSGEPLPSPAPTEGGDGGGASDLGDPFDRRLAVTVGPGDADADAFTVPDGSRLSVTDLVLQNPDGARGRLTVGRGDSVLLRERLENFRDLDYHFVAPITLAAGESLRLGVACENDDEQGDCGAAVYVVGYLDQPGEEGG